jgi:hypothetical protein
MTPTTAIDALISCVLDERDPRGPFTAEARSALLAAIQSDREAAVAEERHRLSQVVAAVPISAIRDVGHQCDSYHLATRDLFARVVATGVVPATEDE